MERDDGWPDALAETARHQLEMEEEAAEADERAHHDINIRFASLRCAARVVHRTRVVIMRITVLTMRITVLTMRITILIMRITVVIMRITVLIIRYGC